MRRWQLVLVATLLLIPILAIVGFGAWQLWQSGWWFWLAWSLPVCWGPGWFLARRWKVLQPIQWPETPKIHWTPKDEGASQLIVREQERVAQLSARELLQPEFYTEEVQRLAALLGAYYRPKSTKPVDHLSVLELLAVVQLSTEDLETWLRTYVPGSHLVTVGQWKLLSKAPGWWQVASNTAWAASIVMNPLNLGRFLASRYAVDPLSKQLQQNLLGTVAMLFVRQTGFYLIELNSGRLRGGAAEYRAWQRKLAGKSPTGAVRPEGNTGSPLPVADATAEPGSEPVTVTIAVVGQVKAGKSSLINCLLGEEQAIVDVLPATAAVQRYQLLLPDCDERLVLLDTPGYSDAGATREQLAAAQAAAREADLMLLVLEARSPAREADRDLLERLAAWYAEQPRLKPPPVLVVVNKVDLLNPALDWTPPYNWQAPLRPKEQSIRGAVEYANEVLGKYSDGVVATTTDRERGRVSGVADQLLPAIAELVDEARATTLIKALHQRLDQDRWRAVWRQVRDAGRNWHAVWQAFSRPKG